MSYLIKNLFLKFILMLTLILLNACAKPDVVNVVKVEDRDLNCKQLNMAILDAKEFKNKAEKVRGETGKNYARAVFFWHLPLRAASPDLLYTFRFALCRHPDDLI